MNLTPRQRDVLELAARGEPNKTIARLTGLAMCTVKAHLHASYRKLGARNRTEAAYLYGKHEA